MIVRTGAKSDFLLFLSVRDDTTLAVGKVGTAWDPRCFDFEDASGNELLK